MRALCTDTQCRGCFVPGHSPGPGSSSAQNRTPGARQLLCELTPLLPAPGKPRNAAVRQIAPEGSRTGKGSARPSEAISYSVYQNTGSSAGRWAVLLRQEQPVQRQAKLAAASREHARPLVPGTASPSRRCRPSPAAAAPTDSATSPAPSPRQRHPHRPAPRVRSRSAAAHRRSPLSVITQPPVSPPGWAGPAPAARPRSSSQPAAAARARGGPAPAHPRAPPGAVT
ncbi:uncharacterized protein [Anomalospiza imberbis]|uniref:uncharacterized protein n=1 Tax=Anomalospiza imberbis TaxID=187417 RepID=UPI00358EA8B6